MSTVAPISDERTHRTLERTMSDYLAISRGAGSYADPVTWAKAEEDAWALMMQAAGRDLSGQPLPR